MNRDPAPMISREDVVHVARLARLELSDTEIERMREQLNGILRYLDKLEELDVGGVEPTSHAVPLVNVIREDTLVPPHAQDAMLDMEPDRAEEVYHVLRIMQDCA